MTRVLALGDVVGKAGRKCLKSLLQKVKEQFHPDLILLNGENAAGGFGLTEKVYREFTEALDIDCITMGNHWHDKREIYDYFPRAARLVLPANMMNVQSEEDGLKVLVTKSGERYAVINLIGRTFMHVDNRNPFDAAEKLLKRIPETVRIRIIDIHAEATSEKQGLAHFLTGRVSLIYGTHSHVPTGDERILGAKTGFTTDIGMTGGYDSVIGMEKVAAIHRLRTGEKKPFEPASGDPWLCAIVADIDDKTGYCYRIERLRWELKSFQE